LFAASPRKQIEISSPPLELDRLGHAGGERERSPDQGVAPHEAVLDIE